MLTDVLVTHKLHQQEDHILPKPFLISTT